MSERHLAAQFRGYPSARIDKRSHNPSQIKWLLTDDTETTTETQRLLFGCGQVHRVDYSDTVSLTLERCYLYYTDDLKRIRPKLYQSLHNYAKLNPDVILMSHSDYLRKVFLIVAQKPDAAITGFNLSFDIWRHASRVSPARGKYYNGLSGEFLNGETPIRYHEIRSGIGMRREFTLRKGQRRVPMARVIDASQLCRALSGDKHSLRTAGIAFNCSPLKYDGQEIHDPEINYTGDDLPQYLEHYIGYCVNDVAATADLWRALADRFAKHPIQLAMDMAFSPPSIGKQYLRDMGIHPVMCVCGACKKKQRGGHKIPLSDLGKSMAAFYGGRAECLVRLVALPVAYVDFTSEYPTSMILLGLWSLLTAERVIARDETREVITLIDSLTIEDCFNPEIVRQLRGFAEVIPEDDWLPLRAEYSEDSIAPNPGVAPNIGINYVSADRSLPWSLADIAASKLLTGRTPHIVRAIRFYPEGKQETLKSINLYGDESLAFDPGSADLLKVAGEQRQISKRHHKQNREQAGWNPDSDKCLCYDCERGRFLKVFINGIYGIFGEMNHQARAEKATGQVWGLDDTPETVTSPEVTGDFCFPPFATMITGMGRLLVAMLQKCVENLGGQLIACDTDSGCIAASPDGGYDQGIKLLTYDQVNQIRERFNSLNPYDQSLVPELLKWEWPALKETDPGYVPLESVRIISLSAKRYCIYSYDEDSGSVRILKRSEHGLGLYLNPIVPDPDLDSSRKPDWINAVWEYIIRSEILRQESPEPIWFDYPAVSSLPIRTLHVWQTLENFNKGKLYADQIKPFNFHLAVHPSAGIPEDVRLIAPFTTESESWGQIEYVDMRTQQVRNVTTDIYEYADNPKLILVKDYREVVGRYIRHPEIKYDGPNGKACKHNTRGILQPCHVTISAYELVSKDATSLLAPDEIFEYSRHRVYKSDRDMRAYRYAQSWYREHGYGRSRIISKVGLTKKEAENFMSRAVSMPRSEAFDKAMSYAVNRAWSEMTDPDMRKLPSFKLEALSPLTVLASWSEKYRAGVIKIPTEKMMPVPLDALFLEDGDDVDPIRSGEETTESERTMQRERLQIFRSRKLRIRSLPRSRLHTRHDLRTMQ